MKTVMGAFLALKIFNFSLLSLLYDFGKKTKMILGLWVCVG